MSDDTKKQPEVIVFARGGGKKQGRAARAEKSDVVLFDKDAEPATKASQDADAAERVVLMR